MGKLLNIFGMVGMSASLLVGCDDRGNTLPDSRKSASNQGEIHHSINSIPDLQRLLIPSMGTNDIIATLGKPIRMEDLPRGETMWRYQLPPFPADGQMRGTYVVGLIIGITNGHLANWGCDYVGGDQYGQRREVPSNRNGKTEAETLPSLRIYVISTDPIAEGRFIDTERFPKLGFIPPTPNLTISKLKKATVEEHTVSGAEDQRTAWSFDIALTQDDAARLKSLTEANVLKNVLIMVGEEPVSAPKIMTPLENGTFVIECRERSLMEAVRSQLANMARE